MKQTTKWLAAALIALGLNQAVWADDVSDFRKTLQEAERGDAAAQNNLGLMYYDGRGVLQDYAEAVRWYRQAAEQGYTDAKRSLGVMYLEGYGVRQNFALAEKWFNEGCGDGDLNSCEQAAGVYNRRERGY